MVCMSSAPASSTVIIISSSSESGVRSMTSTPFLSNMKLTLPVTPREPPFLAKQWRTSLAVRLRLSVMVSTITATPPGA